MEDMDTAARSRHNSCALTANQSISEGEVLGTREGAPAGGGGGGEEEEEEEEEEMALQVQEMKEELAQVYERDLVTLFNLCLALSQPVRCVAPGGGPAHAQVCAHSCASPLRAGICA